MKNKIKSIIQDDIENLDHYLHYVARLSKDFDLGLEFISPVIIENAETAKPILGDGIPEIVRTETPTLDSAIQVKVSEALSQFSAVDYSITDSFSDEKAYTNYQDSLMWTINQTSRDSFLNELLGTIETDLYQKVKLPSLTVPSNCPYQKPKTLLLVIRDTPDLDFTHFNNIMDKLDLRVVYVFHEDEKDISIEEIMNSINVEFKNFIGSVKTVSMEYTSNMLDKILDTEKPEWIAFANYDRSLLERIYKVNTNQLILSSQLPVLNF